MRTAVRSATVGGKYEAVSIGYHGRCGKKAGLAGKLSKDRYLIGSGLVRLRRMAGLTCENKFLSTLFFWIVAIGNFS